MSSKNNGLVEFQDRQRQHTMQLINDAVIYLRTNGLAITKKSIAYEASLSYSTLKKPYVKNFLLRYPELDSDFKSSLPADLNVVQAEIEELKIQLRKERKRKKEIVDENHRLKHENEELREKYQRLLGEYQLQVGKKLVAF